MFSESKMADQKICHAGCHALNIRQVPMRIEWSGYKARMGFVFRIIFKMADEPLEKPIELKAEGMPGMISEGARASTVLKTVEDDFLG